MSISPKSCPLATIRSVMLTIGSMYTQPWLYTFCSSEALTVSPFASWFSPLQGLSPMSTWPIFSLDLSFTAASLPRESDTADLKEIGGHFGTDVRRQPSVFSSVFFSKLCLSKRQLKLHLKKANVKNKNKERMKPGLYHSPASDNELSDVTAI